MYMVFLHQSSNGTGQNLEGYVAFPRKLPKRMHRHCFRHLLASLILQDWIWGLPDHYSWLLRNRLYIMGLF